MIYRATTENGYKWYIIDDVMGAEVEIVEAE